MISLRAIQSELMLASSFLVQLCYFHEAGKQRFSANLFVYLISFIYNHVSLHTGKPRLSNLVDERFIIKIHQNTNNYSYFVDVLVSVRDLRQRKKLVLGLLVVDTST